MNIANLPSLISVNEFTSTVSVPLWETASVQVNIREVHFELANANICTGSLILMLLQSKE